MKVITFLTALAIFMLGGVYFFNEPESIAQAPPVIKKPDRSIEKAFDERLNRVENKVSEAEQAKPEPTPRVIIKKVIITKEVPVEEHKNVLTIGGEQYEVEPMEYKGYNIFNVDSIQAQIVEDEVNDAIRHNDSLKQAAIEHAEENINMWQEFKKLFKRKK